jgi:hypothetical protein
MKLEADKGLVGLLRSGTVNALVKGRIYRDQAPADATMPYIVYTLNAGGDSNETATERGLLMYAVMGVDSRSGMSHAVAAALHADLHRQAALALENSWVATDVKRTSILSQIENDDREQYYINGGLYRWRLVK